MAEAIYPVPTEWAANALVDDAGGQRRFDKQTGAGRVGHGVEM